MSETPAPVAAPCCTAASWEAVSTMLCMLGRGLEVRIELRLPKLVTENLLATEASTGCGQRGQDGRGREKGGGGGGGEKGESACRGISDTEFDTRGGLTFGALHPFNFTAATNVHSSAHLTLSF